MASYRTDQLQDEYVSGLLIFPPVSFNNELEPAHCAFKWSLCGICFAELLLHANLVGIDPETLLWSMW